MHETVNSAKHVAKKVKTLLLIKVLILALTVQLQATFLRKANVNILTSEFTCVIISFY
jgi:hypothetical protein